MDVSIFTESAISDSYIYGMFNTSGEIQTKLVKGLQNGVLITPDFLGEQLLQMEKLRFSPIFQKVLSAYKAGSIRLMHVPDIKITKSLPFIIHKEGQKVVATIFLSSFCKISIDDKSCSIDAKSLYILMESAYIGREFQYNGRMLRRDTTLMKVCNDVYVSMALRILNRDYALSLETSLHDKVSFCISKFFLEKIWECDNSDIVFKYAMGVTTERLEESILPVNEMYEKKNIETIVDLFEFLKTLSVRMNTLTVRFFVERFTNAYGGSAILAIDYLPYMLFVISNILIGGFLVSQTSLNDIIKNTKDIKKYYVELARLV